MDRAQHYQPDVARVREDFNEQPAVESKGRHRVGGERQQIDRICTEVWHRRSSFASPVDYAGANVCDLHDSTPLDSTSFKDCIGRMVTMMSANASTWKLLTTAKTGP